MVTVSRVSDDHLEEDRSSATLKCASDANPPGRIFWRKYAGGSGADETRQYAEQLEFSPVRRTDTGTYVCQAENSIGVSNEEAVEIDVLCELIQCLPQCNRSSFYSTSLSL